MTTGVGWGLGDEYQLQGSYTFDLGRGHICHPGVTSGSDHN